MQTPKEHYEKLLAKHYDWMFGVSFYAKVSEQVELLKKAGLTEPKRVVDLGCGSGFQSFAAIELGASEVVAVDTSGDLLRDLNSRISSEPIKTVCADISQIKDILKAQADTFICMGDTLTHLASLAAVRQLILDLSVLLVPGGAVILSYRDLSVIPDGVDRFIPVRSTDDMHMTCFLEANGPTVVVHDIIHTRKGAGWQMEASAYPKLVIPVDHLKADVVDAGLLISDHFTERGMQVIACRKPNS